MSVTTHHKKSFAEALPSLKDGTQTSRQFLEECLSNIAQAEKDVKAFVVMNVDAARKAADESTKRWKAGQPLSSIDGMPVGIKDVIETIDMPTQMGSAYYAKWQSNRDSATVAALREAGAIILGKTVTTEFAATVPGPTRNPHDLTRTPGGSSSGSAAGVAAGFIAGGLGTQVVGSIVRPAGYCGAWGFKPTLGALNRGGSHDYMSQSCAGVIAATRADTWHMASEIASRVGGDPGSLGLMGPLAVSAIKQPKTLVFLETPGWVRATDQAKHLMQSLLAKLSHAGVRILTRSDLPLIAEVEEHLHEALPLTRIINAWESVWPLNTYVAHNPNAISQNMRDRLVEAKKLNLDSYRAALMKREIVKQSFARLKPLADGCITLSSPDVAPVGLESTGDPIFVVPGSLLGVPALSIPGLKIDAMPLGIQMLGFAHEDHALFGSAGFVENIITGNKNG